MKKFFFILSITFAILFVVNISWIIINIYNWSIDGVQSIIQGTYLLENVYLSTYIKWIFAADTIWIVSAVIFMLQRKHYKTSTQFHYLQHTPLSNPSICVIIPAYNEELSIGKVVTDFFNQKFVKSVIVIDNNSTDHTAEIAEKCRAKVIRKSENKGYSHSLVMGLNEVLKTDANVIVTVDADGTQNAYDLEKMVPYLDNCDMVIGTRQNQVLLEKGNQNSVLHVWGNFFLAKLIQIKYFSLAHVGVVNLTDVGCIFRLIKRNALEKIIKKMMYANSDNAVGGIGIGLYFTMLGIENNLRIIEVPVTFNKRIGSSKIGSNKFLKAIKIGLSFFWLILKT